MKDYKNIYPPRIPRKSDCEGFKAICTFVFMLILISVCGWSVIEYPKPNPPIALTTDKGEIIRLGNRQILEHTSSVNAHYEKVARGKK